MKYVRIELEVVSSSQVLNIMEFADKIQNQVRVTPCDSKLPVDAEANALFEAVRVTMVREVEE